MANLEREYKFGLPNNWTHFTVQQFDMVGHYLTNVERFIMEATDYDTEGMTLNAGGNSLRCRVENGEKVYTLKVLREDDGNGLRVRDEYEVKDDCTLNFALHDIFSRAIDAGDKQCQDLICSIIYPLATDDYDAHLIVSRKRDFERYEFTVKFRDVTLAIAVDVGIKINRGQDNAERIRKIDLEYKEGNVETFEKYVQAFEFITGLRRIAEANVTDLNYDL